MVERWWERGVRRLVLLAWLVHWMTNREVSVCWRLGADALSRLRPQALPPTRTPTLKILSPS
jgi:hypothetical protein